MVELVETRISKNLLLPVRPLAGEECPDKSGRGVLKYLNKKSVELIQPIQLI
jgi:hypothetical protein